MTISIDKLGLIFNSFCANWRPETKQAVQDVLLNGLSMYAAAEKNGVNRSTVGRSIDTMKIYIQACEQYKAL